MNTLLMTQVSVGEDEKITGFVGDDFYPACAYCHELLSKEEIEDKNLRKLLLHNDVLSSATVFHLKCYDHRLHDCPKCKQHTMIERKTVSYCIAPLSGKFGEKKCNYIQRVPSAEERHGKGTKMHLCSMCGCTYHYKHPTKEGREIIYAHTANDEVEILCPQCYHNRSFDRRVRMRVE